MISFNACYASMLGRYNTSPAPSLSCLIGRPRCGPLVYPLPSRRRFVHCCCCRCPHLVLFAFLLLPLLSLKLPVQMRSSDRLPSHSSSLASPSSYLPIIFPSFADHTAHAGGLDAKSDMVYLVCTFYMSGYAMLCKCCSLYQYTHVYRLFTSRHTINAIHYSFYSMYMHMHTVF